MALPVKFFKKITENLSRGSGKLEPFQNFIWNFIVVSIPYSISLMQFYSEQGLTINTMTKIVTCISMHLERGKLSKE